DEIVAVDVGGSKFARRVLVGRDVEAGAEAYRSALFELVQVQAISREFDAGVLGQEVRNSEIEIAVAVEIRQCAAARTVCIHADVIGSAQGENSAVGLVDKKPVYAIADLSGAGNVV